MKQFLLLTYCLLVGLSYSTFAQSNETNLRSINAGGKVIQDLAKNDWQFSIGGTFVAPIITDTVVITQGFNQPDIWNDIVLMVYNDTIKSVNEIEHLQSSNFIIGTDTSALSIQQNFILRNLGNTGDLIIDSIVVVNNNYNINQNNFTIAKRSYDTLSVSLAFDTIASYQDTIYIYSNSIGHNPFVFPIYGEITKDPEPEMVIQITDTTGNTLNNSDILSFGSIEKNQDSTRTITITNEGVGNLMIDSITVDNINFEINASIDTIKPGEVFSFDITLSGENSGIFNGVLSIFSNDLINEVFTINIDGNVINSTTWTGTSWTNGAPNSGSIVVLESNYSTLTHGGFSAEKLTIKGGTSLILHDNTSSIIISDSVINNGSISTWCLNPSLFSNFSGNKIDTIKASITSINSLEGTYEEAFNTTFQINQFTLPTWTISGHPFNLTSVNNNISGIPVQEGVFPIIVTATQNNCTIVDTFNIEISSLPDPDLYIPSYFILNCSKPRFSLSPSRIGTGKISYKQLDTNSCVILDTLTGEIETVCSEGKFPVEIEISVAKTDLFRGSKTSTSILFEKEIPEFELLQSTFDLFSGTTSIPYYTNSTSTPEFSLFGSSSTKINLDSTGKIIPLDLVEDLPILVKVPESSCYSRLYDTLYITIIKTPLPPVANNDTVFFYLYQSDIVINLYQNDYGVTAQLDSSELRLDLENDQNFKFLDIPGVGFFRESKDVFGTVIFQPDPTFLGTESITYQISDEDGQVAFGEIIISVLVEDEIPNLEYRELYTPNNDGLNDIFIIGYLNYENPGSLTVIDRLGNELFHRDDYVNDWDFTDQNGDMVDDGAYFFVYIEEGREKLQGTFEIKRR